MARTTPEMVTVVLKDLPEVRAALDLAVQLREALKEALHRHVENECPFCDDGCPLGEHWRSLIAKSEDGGRP